MTLEQCTKSELIQIIKQINWLCESHVKCALFDIEKQRMQKRFKEAEEYSRIATENLNKYIETLKPYEGKKVTDIPSNIILKAAKYEKAYTEAQKKEEEIMKKVVKNDSKMH